jgi:co-chaperonin GroES (HSP10)
MDDNKIYVALNANVFVKEIQQEVRQGSMLLPDSLDKDFIYGEVISVADGYFDHGTFVPSCVQPGDIIAFPKVSSTKINFNNVQMLRVMQSDIVAKQVTGTVDMKD